VRDTAIVSEVTAVLAFIQTHSCFRTFENIDIDVENLAKSIEAALKYTSDSNNEPHLRELLAILNELSQSYNLKSVSIPKSDDIVTIKFDESEPRNDFVEAIPTTVDTVIRLPEPCLVTNTVTESSSDIISHQSCISTSTQPISTKVDSVSLSASRPNVITQEQTSKLKSNGWNLLNDPRWSNTPLYYLPSRRQINLDFVPKRTRVHATT
jgi:hypothetical protein